MEILEKILQSFNNSEESPTNTQATRTYTCARTHTHIHTRRRKFHSGGKGKFRFSSSILLVKLITQFSEIQRQFD